MSSRSRRDGDNVGADIRNRDHPPLPPWIVRKLLDWDEHVTWVRGPESGSLERVVTNPLLFVFALVVGVLLVVVGCTIFGRQTEIQMAMIVGAILLVLGSVFVLGIAHAYFTRLVVTNRRLMIIQGLELVRSWRVDRLPRSLVRYDRSGSDRDSEVSRTVDVEALKSILGGKSDNSSTSQGIMSLGKQIDRIRADEKNGRD